MNTREKLERRVAAIERAAPLAAPGPFRDGIRSLLALTASDPALNSIIEEMRTCLSPEQQAAFRVVANLSAVPPAKNDSEIAFRAYVLLEQITLDSSPEQYIAKLAEALRVNYRRQEERGPAIFSAYVRPLLDFLIEQLEDRSRVLDLFARYRRRAEWFQRGELRKRFEDGKAISRQELFLKEDLYANLFDQGLPFVAEPQSPSGNVDVLSLAPLSEVVLEVKVFEEGDSASKLRDGVGQLYRYVRDHGAASGILLVFNASHKPVVFRTEDAGQGIARFRFDGRLLNLLVIDIGERGRSASKEGMLKAVEIREEQLVEWVNSSDPEERALSPTTDTSTDT